MDMLLNIQVGRWVLQEQEPLQCKVRYLPICNQIITNLSLITLVTIRDSTVEVLAVILERHHQWAVCNPLPAWTLMVTDSLPATSHLLMEHLHHKVTTADPPQTYMVCQETAPRFLQVSHKGL